MNRKKRTHCFKGHILTSENTYVHTGKDGLTRRACKVCRLRNALASQDRNRIKINDRRRARRVRKPRIYLKKTHCVHGHEFTSKNTRLQFFDGYPRQICRACKREWHKRNRGLNGKPKVNKNQNTDKTHCVHGHEFTFENTWVKGGHRVCRICHREDQRFRSSGRRAKKAGTYGSHTKEQWKVLKNFFGSACLCCGLSEDKLKDLGRKLAADHIVPIAKGGTNDIENIQPLCHGVGGCNNKKGTKFMDYREAGLAISATI